MGRLCLPIAFVVAGLGMGLATADTTAVSQLAARPARLMRNPLELPAAFDVEVSASWVSVQLPPGSASVGSCLVNGDLGRWTRGDEDLDEEYRNGGVNAGASPSLTVGLERLVVHGDEAELERTTVNVGPRVAVPIERGRIALRPVARRGDLVVYAFRSADSVFVLAPTTAEAMVRFDSEQPRAGRGVERRQSCNVALTQLRLRPGSSQATQIEGTLGHPYLVEASLTQTSRDPVPLLSVSVRYLDAL